MCGIVGVIGKECSFSLAFEGLRALEYRGYDSFGFGAVTNRGIETMKHVGAVSEARELDFSMFKDVRTIIGHTRWATHGKVTQANSHPHVSADGAVAIVHNGVIANYAEIISQHPEWALASDTDTEAVANLIASELKKAQGDIVTALSESIKKVEGEFAICGLIKDRPDCIFVIKRKSPLAIGKAAGNTVLSSDRTAFAEISSTFEVMQLEDESILISDDKKIELFQVKAGKLQPIELTFKTETLKKEQDSLAGYPHYMIKEISESGNAIRNALKEIERDLNQIVDALSKQNIYMTGAGSAYYVSMIAQYLFHDLTGKYVAVHPADEFLNLKQISSSDIIIGISQSGETFDTLEVLRSAKENNAQIFAINNVRESTMQRMADFRVFQNSGREVCVLSTKSVISQIVSLYLLSLEIGKRSDVLKEKPYADHQKDLSRLPIDVENVIRNLSEKIENIAQKYCHVEHWFFIGRGIHYPVALENALKFKEVSYLHAEGMSAGFFKHGTISLIDDNFYTMVFLPSSVTNHELFQATIDNVHEIKARGGNVIGIGNKLPESGVKKLFLEYVELPDLNNQLNVLPQLIIGQLLAYHCGLALDRNIDRPRALAKSVTVR